MRIRVVGKRHYVSLGLPFVEDFPRQAQSFVRECELDPIDYSVVATHRGKLVGFVRLNLWRRDRGKACGTWVATRYRRSGLALRLWSHALRLLRRVRGRKPMVTITVVSKAGRKLARRVRAEHRDVRVLLKGRDR